MDKPKIKEIDKQTDINAVNDESRFDLKSVCIEILKLAIWPVISSMFNPVYMIVNSMILGRGDQHAKLAAFGLGSSTNSMLLVCTGSVFASAANILVS